jgi:hypothetical protein
MAVLTQRMAGDKNGHGRGSGYGAPSQGSEDRIEQLALARAW